MELFNLILSNFVCPLDRGLILLFIEQQLKNKSYFLDGESGLFVRLQRSGFSYLSFEF